MTDYITVRVGKRDFTVRTSISMSEPVVFYHLAKTRVTRGGDTRITRSGDTRIVRVYPTGVILRTRTRKRGFTVRAKVTHG